MGVGGVETMKRWPSETTWHTCMCWYNTTCDSIRGWLYSHSVDCHVFLEKSVLCVSPLSEMPPLKEESHIIINALLNANTNRKILWTVNGWRLPKQSDCEGRESISLDSRFADLENPRVKYNLKLIVYFNYNHNYNYKNLVFFPYVYGDGHG